MENVSLSLLNQLQETPSSLQEARNLLQEVGPVRNYIITFTDSAERITFILGLNEDNLELAEWIDEDGSFSVFGELTQDLETLQRLSKPTQEELERLARSRENLETMYKNGFHISLGERAILDIESSETGDTDDQRLRMLLALVTYNEGVREPVANNHTIAVLPRGYYDEGIVMAAAADESLAPGSFIRGRIKPEYDTAEVSDAMKEIVPNIKFQITGRNIIIPIDDLRRHLKSFYGYEP
nr:hypothetical protein Cbor_176 [Cedratvirus borely]